MSPQSLAFNSDFVSYDRTSISVETAVVQDFPWPILTIKHHERTQEQSNFECNSETAATQQGLFGPFSTEYWQHQRNFEYNNGATEQDMLSPNFTEN